MRPRPEMGQRTAVPTLRRHINSINGRLVGRGQGGDKGA